MSAKIVFTSALALALIGLAPTLAQDVVQNPTFRNPTSQDVVQNPTFRNPTSQDVVQNPTSQVDELPTPSVLGPTQPVPMPPSPSSILFNGMAPGETAPGMPYGLSNWITYNRNGVMSGPVGNYKPIKTELILRNGFSVPTSATIVGRTLETGWDITGGGRLLFFNAPMTRAWTLEASITNIYQSHSSNSSTIHFPLNVIDPTGPTVIANGVPVNASFLHFGSGGLPGVTVRSLNRTFVNLGAGREWYLVGTGASPGFRWRVGADGGGRWGTAKMQLFEFKHRTDTIGGVYAAFHSDVEYPYGCCTWFAGVRGEWDYTWMDILQTTSDVMSINALITAGLRF